MRRGFVASGLVLLGLSDLKELIGEGRKDSI